MSAPAAGKAGTVKTEQKLSNIGGAPSATAPSKSLTPDLFECRLIKLAFFRRAGVLTSPIRKW